MTAGTTTSEGMTRRELSVVIGAIAMTLFLSALDQTIVSTALPTMVGELGGLDQYAWVVTSYMLTSTIGMPLFGKISDLIGRKVVLQSAVVIFLAGSVLAGAAQDMPQLIATRGLQGIGGGGIMAMSFVVMGDLVSPRERGKYVGYFTGVFAVSSVVGPLVGGFLVDSLSWRWIFYVNVPLGGIALALTQKYLRMDFARQQRRIDWLGAALMVGAVTSALLVSSWGGQEHEWLSPTIIGLAVAAMVLGGLFIVQERRAPEPLLPLRLFGDAVIRISTALSFVLGVVMMGSMTFLPLFLQVVIGATPTTSGLLLLPMMGGVLVGSMLAGRLTTRWGRYRIFPIVGTGIAITGVITLSRLDVDSSRIHSSLGMVLLGFGIGMTMPTLTLAVQNASPMADMGAATSAVNFFRTLGGSIGVAVFGAVMASRVSDIPSRLLNSPAAIRALPEGQRTPIIDALADGVQAVFVVAIPVIVIAFALAWLLQDRPLRTTLGDAPGPVEAAAEGAAEASLVPTASQP
ncbi:MAG TPA: MDR family MFS transporter [Acidimicrobiales bacterium]|nr:MDR family MFS transporter [Acidimicrobiales bacterium]